MKARSIVLSLAALAIAGAAAYAAYRAGMRQGMNMPSASSGASVSGGDLRPGSIDPATGKKILYWHDPMVPGQKFDKPGKSPFMDMQLVPVYEDQAGQGGGVKIGRAHV